MQRLCMSKNALSELHVTTTTRVDEKPKKNEKMTNSSQNARDFLE